MCRNTKISAKTVFSTLNVKNFIIAGHEHSTRDLCGHRLISIKPVITEQNHREPPQTQFLAEYVNKTHILTCILQHFKRKKVLSAMILMQNSHAKCFITTNSTAKLYPGAMYRGEVLRACFRDFLLCSYF